MNPPLKISQMRAVTQDRYGTAEVLSVETIPRPILEKNQVLIEVHAAGIDRGTEHLMTGMPYLIRLGFGLSAPKQPVLGFDVAGTIVSTGSAVTRFEVGEEVFGIGSGSCAEFAAADENKIARKPSNISFEEAAASTVSGITALEALIDVAGTKAGQKVLVVGASGGVGTFALQLAKAIGAHVDGVAGSRNLELVRSLGAQKVYDYKVTDIASIEERYDVILDIGGRNPVWKLRKILEPNGTLVFVGGENGNRFTGGIGRQISAIAFSALSSQSLKMFISNEHHLMVERLGAFLEAGDVVPAIGNRFQLHQVQDAMAQIAKGQTSGKSVILIKEASAKATLQRKA